jgi:hypothetical protein
MSTYLYTQLFTLVCCIVKYMSVNIFSHCLGVLSALDTALSDHCVCPRKTRCSLLMKMSPADGCFVFVLLLQIS